MIKIAIRLIVHAMFGVGVIAAWAVWDTVEAGSADNAKHSSAAARQLRGASEVDGKAEPTEQSQAPKVLNRWDMRRRPEANATADLPTAPAIPVVPAVKAPTHPVVSTVMQNPGASEQPVKVLNAASPAEPAPSGNSAILCLAGCVEAVAPAPRR
jgi:hypothetical protein